MLREGRSAELYGSGGQSEPAGDVTEWTDGNEVIDISKEDGGSSILLRTSWWHRRNPGKDATINRCRSGPATGYGLLGRREEQGQVLHHSLEENNEESAKMKKRMPVMELLVSIEVEQKFRGPGVPRRTSAQAGRR